MERSFRTNLIDAIMDQASQDEKIVVLNADSARALCLTKFAETYPERMINVGISETDLIGTAAGLATTGLKPNIINLRLDITHLYYPAKNSFQKGRLKRREIFTELLLYTLTT